MIKKITNAGTDVTEDTGQPTYVLRLYVTGATPNSIRAISNIRAICSEYLAGKVSLEITDVYRHREIAAREQLVALPMLVKTSPYPTRRLIGDMSDTGKVLDALGIKSEK